MAGKVFSRLSMKDEEKKCVLLAGPLGLHQHLVQEKALLEKLFPQQGVLQKPTLALVVENFSCEIASGFFIYSESFARFTFWDLCFLLFISCRTTYDSIETLFFLHLLILL